MFGEGMSFEPEHGSIAFAAKVEHRRAEWSSCFKPHRHTQLELIFVVQGEFQFATEAGEEQFYPGDVYMVNSGEAHKGSSEVKGHYYYVQLSLKQVPRGISEELDRLVGDLERRRIRLPLRIPAEQAKENGLFERGMELVGCFSKKNGYNEFKLLCKSLELFQIISEHRLYAEVEREELSGLSFERQVAEYVDAHCTEDLRLKTVAAFFGYEPHYFCALFKKHFLVTFTRYLRVVRIQKFLSHPNLNLQTIAQCAADVGFSNYSYFYQTFRRTRGCSPREFLMRTRK